MATGDIGATIETVVFDAACIKPHGICLVAGGVYVVAYCGPDSDGFIKTYSIDEAGDISATAIDTWEYDTNRAINASIIHISGTVFAIAYNDSVGDGALFTFAIAADGTITKARIATGIFDAGTGDWPHIIHVSGIIYAIAYMGPAARPYVRTVSISDDGLTINYNVDFLEMETHQGNRIRITHVTGDIYVFCYYDETNAGHLKTVSIGGDGAISDTVLSAVDYDAVQGLWARAVKTATGKFTIVYTGPDNDGWIKTFTIAGDGTITATPIEAYEFNATEGQEPDICHVGETWYAVVHYQTVNHCMIRTIEIADDGNIVTPYHASADLVGERTYLHYMIHIGGDLFVVAYLSGTSSGQISTITISAPGGKPGHLMMMGIG